MAYISTQEVKAIREEIKKVLTAKDGFKFSISREHYYGVRIVLLQTPLEMDLNTREINHYRLKNIECSNTRLIFQLVQKAITRVMGENVDRNAGDMGADYCDYNFYQTLKVGEWNNECKLLKTA